MSAFAFFLLAIAYNDTICMKKGIYVLALQLNLCFYAATVLLRLIESKVSISFILYDSVALSHAPLGTTLLWEGRWAREPIISRFPMLHSFALNQSPDIMPQLLSLFKLQCPSQAFKNLKSFPLFLLNDSSRDMLQRCDILVTEDSDSVLCNSEFLNLDITFSGVTPSAYHVGMSLAYLWTLAHIHSSSPLHSQGLLLH
jgi:hypothetical protein